MKNRFITRVATLFMAIGVMSSCQKDEDSSPVANNANSPIETNESDLARKIMYSTYEKYMALENSELGEIMRKAEEIILNDKYYEQKSGEDYGIPLGDIFFVYEGAVNGIYAATYPPESEIATAETTIEVPVYTENDQYFIEVSDMESLMTTIATEINGEVGTNQQLSIADLNLDQINGSTATITVNLLIATPPPATQLFPLYPGGAVYGAQKAGWCSNTSVSIDAADFVRGHVNSQGLLAQPNPPGQPNRNPVTFGSWAPWDNDLNIKFGAAFRNSLGNYYWQNPNNVCIGSDVDQNANEAAWLSLYSSAVHPALDPTVIAYFSGINPNINASFLNTDLHSHSAGNPFVQNPPGPIPTYYHGGRHNYGIVIYW